MSVSMYIYLCMCVCMVCVYTCTHVCGGRSEQGGGSVQQLGQLRSLWCMWHWPYTLNPCHWLLIYPTYLKSPPADGQHKWVSCFQDLGVPPALFCLLFCLCYFCCTFQHNSMHVSSWTSGLPHSTPPCISIMLRWLCYITLMKTLTPHPTCAA